MDSADAADPGLAEDVEVMPESQVAAAVPPAPFAPAAAPFQVPPSAAAPPAAAPAPASSSSFVGGGGLGGGRKPEGGKSPVEQYLRQVEARWNNLMDASVPHLWGRWAFTSFLALLYVLRVTVFIEGWYIVTYALGIYLLNLLIGFISPKDDFENLDGPMLPTKNDDEFRPFERRLPEYKCWFAATRAFLMALTATFFEICNIPVFWPILLVYFVALFAVTMKKQIMHMRKYKYLPWNSGKAQYGKSRK